MSLSKSDYMLFLKHPAWLWLKKFEKYKLPKVNANTQAMFDAGHEFEAYVEKLFPAGVKLGFRYYDEYLSLPLRTSQALSDGASTIFQGRFEAEGLTCIVDVLEKVGENEYNLIEIKSSTKVKPEHEYDLAFQLLVLEMAGIKVGNVAVIHVNKEYVRDGEIDSEAFTVRVDVTGAVKLLDDETRKQVEAAQRVLAEKTMPDPSPRYVNQVGVKGTDWFGDWMEVYLALKPDLDAYSIYHLSYPSAEQIGELEDQGIKTIGEIPEELALRPKQKVQIQTTRTGQRIIDRDKIKAFLETFQYPLYFFDYETMSDIIPVFDGMRPYQDYPFQYSLHIQDSPDAEVRHTEYLHAERSNPMPRLIQKLQQDIGDSGTILTWNMKYEKGCNDRMAAFYPEHKDFLASVNDRIDDLMTPFAKMWFFDKNFFGSASVKYVLPALVPELSYKDLAVQDGLFARRVWTETVLHGKNQVGRDRILSDLSAYCTLDTYAMVKILEVLRKIVYE